MSQQRSQQTLVSFRDEQYQMHSSDTHEFHFIETRPRSFDERQSGTSQDSDDLESNDLAKNPSSLGDDDVVDDDV